MHCRGDVRRSPSASCDAIWTKLTCAACSMPGSRKDCARNALPVDPVVVRRRLRALERSLRILRSLRARGRDAFLSDEVIQDRAERHAAMARVGEWFAQEHVQSLDPGPRHLV